VLILAACCNIVQITAVIYSILVSFKICGLNVPEDGIKDIETCSNNIRLCFEMLNVHLLALQLNKKHIFVVNANLP